MRIPANVRFTLIFVLPFSIIIYFLVNFFAPSSFTDVQTEVEYWNKKEDYFRSSLAALSSLKEHQNAIHSHYDFLSNYCLLKKRERDLIKDDIETIFGDLSEYYLKLLEKNPKNPIGFYGYWKLKSYLDIDDKNLEDFRVADSIDIKSPFINELRGDIFHHYKKANDYYQVEIDLYPNNQQAKIKLFNRLVWLEKTKQLESLLNDEMILSEPSLHSTIRYYYFKNDFYKWLSSVSQQSILFNDYLVWLNATIILIVWICFFFYIDVFSDINKRILFLGAIVSIISIPFVVSVYDAYYFSGEYGNEENIFWSNFLVGLFEETSKIIFPLLIAVFFRSKLKSPFSVMILFSFSALIFSTLENMNYFENYYDITIVSVRAIYCVIIHLAATTIAAYGYVLYKFRNKSIFIFLLTFVLGIILHMVYDILVESFITYLSIPLVIISAFVLFSIYNNLLNNSPHFNHEKEERLNKSGFVLIVGLTIVMLVEFSSVSFKYGLGVGNDTLLHSALSYGWLILVFASPVSNFKLVKGKWAFIDFGGLKPLDNYANDILEIEVKPVSSNASAYRLKILGTVRANSEKKWFHCFQENTQEYYLLSFKEDGDHLIDSHILLFVLRAEKEVPHAFNPKSYQFLGMVYSNPVFNE